MFRHRCSEAEVHAGRLRPHENVFGCGVGSGGDCVQGL